jgi:hypothetical protein
MFNRKDPKARLKALESLTGSFEKAQPEALEKLNEKLLKRVKRKLSKALSDILNSNEILESSCGNLSKSSTGSFHYHIKKLTKILVRLSQVLGDPLVSFELEVVEIAGHVLRHQIN